MYRMVRSVTGDRSSPLKCVRVCASAIRRAFARHGDRLNHWRLFWAVMLIGHTPGWLAVTAAFAGEVVDALHALRWLVLTLSQVLFAAKLVNPNWLRVHCDRRSWVALTLVLVLLHGDVLRRVCTHESLEAAPAVPVLAAATVLVGVLPRLLPAVVRLASSPSMARCALRLRSYVETAYAVMLSTPLLPALVRVCPDRAPPR